MTTRPAHINEVPWLVRQVAAFIFIQVWRWKIKGDFTQSKKAVVIGAPHTSNWDGPAALLAALALGVHFRWMGKKSLFKFPMRPISYLLGGIPIDRSSRHNAVEQMIEYVNQQETIFLCIAPEGTRKRTTYWKTGFYHIALATGVPIVCAKIDWGNRTIDVSTSFMPTGDMEADMERIRGIYQGVIGKCPANFGEIMLPPQAEALPQ